MLLLCALCSVLIGWLLGGRLFHFEGVGLRWPLLPAAALLCQAGLGLVSGLDLGPYLLVLSYLLLFLFFWQNRHLTASVIFLGLGSLSNFAVIALNDFAMPVSQRALTTLSPEGIEALASGSIPMYRLADSATHFSFLGDILWVPIPFFQGFASIGDILLCIGIFFMIMAIMAPVRLPFFRRQNSGCTK